MTDAATDVDQAAFRTVLGHFATGVTVVTVDVSGVRHGMTANAVASLSLDPPLVLVCVERTAWMHELLAAARGFAVSVLARDQEALAVRFASRLRDDPQPPVAAEEFAGLEWSRAPRSGSPVLGGALAYLDCDVEAIHAGGDHSIYVGRVHALDVLRSAPPLLFYRGEYGDLGV